MDDFPFSKLLEVLKMKEKLWERMIKLKEEVKKVLGNRRSINDFKYSDFWDEEWGKETELRKKLRKLLKEAEELEGDLNDYVLEHGEDKPRTQYHLEGVCVAPDFFEGGGYSKYLDLSEERYKEYQDFKGTVNFVRDLLSVFRFVE